MVKLSRGRHGRKLGEECYKKAAVKEKNSNGFILVVRLAILCFGRVKAAWALEQPGLQGGLCEAIS